MAQITAKDVQEQVRHWLNCPPNGYLGSPYGAPLKDMLQRPLSGGDGDAFLAKLRRDVQIIDAAPAGSVNLYSAKREPDKREILIEVGGDVIASSEVAETPKKFKATDVRAHISNTVFYGFVDQLDPTPSQVAALASREQDTALGSYVCTHSGSQARYLCLAFPYEYALPTTLTLLGFTYQLKRTAMRVPAEGVLTLYHVLRLTSPTFATSLTVGAS